MDYATLKTELAKPEYSGLTNKEAAALLNAPSVSVPNPGTWITELGVLNVLGPSAGATFLNAIELARADQTVGPLLTVAVRWLRSTQGLDVGNAVVQAQLSQLAAAEIVTAEAAAALIAYGSKQISRAEQLGLEAVGDGHVKSAREMA